jgi:hypothetical protein
VTYFTLSSNTFAKSCGIQDASVGLCVTSALDSNNTCTLKSSSRYNNALLHSIGFEQAYSDTILLACLMHRSQSH